MKKRWQLKSEDFWLAKRYLEKKLEGYKGMSYLEHLHLNERQKAEQELRENTRNATMLQDWIEKYLEKEQIQRLRTYLRVEKSRSGKDLQTITLRGDTRARLAEFAKRNNVTLSRAIDMLLDRLTDI